jgi:ABC-type sugar transport system substrate-binding protein
LTIITTITKEDKMKKRIVATLLVVALALTMAVGLVGCDNDSQSGTTPPASSPPAGSQAPPPGGGTVGYVTDDVDHWARDEYHIVYFNFNPTGITGQITVALEQLSAVYNFRLTQQTANNDSDAFINGLQTILIAGGADGLIVDITEELATRTAALLQEFGVPAVCLFNVAADVNGHMVIPSVNSDQFGNGRTQLTHLANHYQDFWGDIDSSEIALLVVDYSRNLNLHERYLGARTTFESLFPGQTVFHGDTLATSSEDAFNVVNSIISANPQIPYWFVVATLEDLGLGSARAVEALGLEDRVLITSSGASILPSQWDEGWEGPWIANYSVPPFMFAGTALFGLLAMVDGRAAMDTLWSDTFLPGDRAARFTLSAHMMTRETYKEHIANFMRQFGIEP